MTLYTKHRPTSFDQIVGNEATISALQSFVVKKDRPHSYMFSGPPGVGKTTSARIFARDIGSDDLSIFEKNMSETRGIDAIREIIERSKFPSATGADIVWILDEAHGLTPEAANSILKILEDTPEWVYFILCTTEPNKINKAVRERCVSFSFTTLSGREIRSVIRPVMDEEEIVLEPETLKLLSEVSGGIARRALVLLDVVSNIEGVEKRLHFLKEEADVVDEENAEFIDFLRLVNRGGGSWKQIANHLRSFEKQNMDPEKIRRSCLSYLSKVLLGQSGRPAIQTSKRMYELQAPTFNVGFAGLVNQIFRAAHME